MRFYILRAVVAATAVLIPCVFSTAATDEYRDADQAQSGYLPNHNMDPNVVNSAGFGQLWRIFTGGADTTAGEGGGDEGFLAHPLVYTTTKGGYSGKQIVIACSETNWVYVLDANTGTIYNKRQLHRPFLVSDIACNDINPQVGITGTPVIDPQTDVMYLYSKTYIGGANGYPNGVYYFHAIDVNTLNDVYAPVNVNGGPATNDPNKNIYFTGGSVLQRPALSLINGAVWAGFGGHCDNFNYTGWVIGVDAASGNVFERFSTEVGPYAPLQDGTNNYKAGGGGSGIWQSGMSLTSDSPSRLFFVTGNDYARANTEAAASGRTPIGTLGQAIANLAIDPTTRQLSLTDYFEPYEYITLDGGDRDLGSSGLTALDPTVFKGTNVAHIGVTVGKNGKAYVVNMDNLGGYKNGPSGGDLVLQTINMPGGQSVFGGVGSYPLEGGFIYVTPVGYPTQVYKYVPDANGNPSFTLVSQTPDSSSGRVGSGPPVVTTNNGAAGTAILWVTDVDAGMRAYYAVPQSDGSMKRINMPPAPAIHKYQRPVFGNGKVYLGCVDGHIICLGSPVAQPFTCNTPLDFGAVTLGSANTQTITCTANIAVTTIVGLTLTNPLFQASNSSLPKGSLAAGQAFSFPATFNLTQASIQNTVGTSYSNVKPGVASGSITLMTVNGVTGYATVQPLAVSGKTVSQNGFLSLSPTEIDFGGLVINSAAAQAGSPGSLIITNLGSSSLTITGSSWVNSNVQNSSPVNITQIGNTGQYTVGTAFNATNWPQPGFFIGPGASVSVTLTFRGSAVGSFGSLITIWSTGGNLQTVLLAGAMATAPVAALTVNNGAGGAFQSSVTGTTKDPTDGSTIIQVGVDFGNVSPGQSHVFTLRMSNAGGSSLLITKSKPPQGQELTASNPTGDLSEGLQISPNSHSDGTVLFAPSPALSHINSDPRAVSGTWTLNVNDLTFGVHVVTFTGTVVVSQFGPLNSAGHSVYKWLGCYQDTANNGPRLLTGEYENGNSNENGLCQRQASAAGAVFAGTEYHTQCWYGNAIPSSQFVSPDSVNHCSWTCPGDATQPCGGDGGYINIFYDSTKYNPTTGVCTGCSNSPSPPAGGGGGSVVIEKTVGSYGYIGCYTEATNQRALSGAAFTSGTNTPDGCAASCAGYSYFGVEYANECYCGNAINAGSVLATNGDSECNMPCSGNASEYCGAGNRLTMYHLGSTPTTTNPGTTATPSGAPTNKASVGSYGFYGCQTEIANARALNGASFTSTTMTLETCMTNCAAFSMFGTEYGSECYCGNSLGVGSTVAPATDCNFACSGDKTEICGAGNRLSIYSKGSATITTPSTTPTGPAIKQTIGSATYYGCQTEATSIRALSGASFVNSAMTLEMCIADCAGYTYAGAEYGTECYCGNSFNTGSTVAPGGNADCNMACPGNTAEFCGAGSRLSVYKLGGSLVSTTTTSSPKPTGPVHVPSVGNYKWQGCYTEGTNIRALNSASLTDTTAMTVEKCASFCTPTYPMFGVEYASECYCGTTLQAGSVLAATSDCSMTCVGNSGEYCGAGNRLDVYK